MANSESTTTKTICKKNKTPPTSEIKQDLSKEVQGTSSEELKKAVKILNNKAKKKYDIYKRYIPSSL